ncbi:MAG TPA: LapD/MoxY N-terminal periplasmic domain-containing protein [Burkholderiaceae bacterium]|nr:LapD/MoxY N-terminal periplasmic domain-containing protein [Burkholderiaceae bacterium]
MTLMRQIGLLLIAVLLLALVGAVGVNLGAARDTLATQLRIKNADNAQSLALALSQQRGDAALMELLLAAQFDTGFYQRVRLVRADGSVAFAREASVAPQRAPAWFARAWPIESVPGRAQVSDGWRALGQVEVVSHGAFAHDELWRGGARSLAWMAAIGAVALALAAAGVGRIRRPLDATVAQANALVDGRYLQVEEPRVPELARVARAMNGMVERVRRLFEAQAAQVEQLRREAHEDRVTALPHRAHFVQRFAALLADDGGAVSGSLLLVRVAALAELNRELGREATDRALTALAGVLRAWPVEAALAGRLNGADFALALPGVRPADAPAEALAVALRDALAAIDARVAAHVGAVAWARAEAGAERPLPGPLLARADLALARAEGAGAFAFHTESAGDAAEMSTSGQEDWHRRLLSALAAERAQLAAYPVIDAGGRIVHLESPLRVQLDAGGALEPALRWLPLAQRSRLLPALDLTAVRLALRAIAVDGQARAVNLALASIADGGFAAHLRELLAAAPEAAPKLWLEVGEAAAVEQFELLRAFATLVRPLGVKFGLEHAGHALHRLPRLVELGLDYVKLDASLVRGAGRDDAVRRFVGGCVGLLAALPVQVGAEGVADEADAQALWACGVGMVTGPWASART